MAPVYDKIASLNPIRDNWNILVRVIRFWTIRVGGQTTEIDMILMDDKGSRIQATVNKHIATKYDKLIREGAVYAIQNFTLANNTGGFKVADHEYKITIQGETIALLQYDSLVPATIWNSVKFDDVLGGVLDDSLLVDVIGLLSRVGEQRNFDGGKKMKQIVLNSFGVELTCSFWGHYVDEIDRYLSTNDPTNVVVVIMCGKIKEFQGKRSIQNMLHCCKIMFNPTILVALEFKESMAQQNPSLQQGVGHIVDASQVSLKDDFLNLHERKTLSDLKDLALTVFLKF
ncbi:replication protein A 70 kDa DNA-binding subunit D-like [Lotus japonicus]|uniref:replication protein A 70 kDa DNA-binding subunit D-like n=1 Tax=Lotus japonicus TaxID=34305 RepID=UPI002588C59D|nr:replication protein A 70 kDa DNA-binding subunit D-like [Lotus japonicus]